MIGGRIVTARKVLVTTILKLRVIEIGQDFFNTIGK